MQCSSFYWVDPVTWWRSGLHVFMFVYVCVFISSKIEKYDVSNALENEDHSEILLNKESRVDINLVFVIKVPTKP